MNFMDSEKKLFSTTRKNTILFSLYLLATLILVFYHEPWQDELHIWCVARDLSIPEIFYRMRFDGHFALWYLLVKLFASTGFPLSTLNLISWLLCAAAAWLFLRFAKLNFWGKALFLLSCPMIYYFPVIARPYALIPLSLCFVALLYPVRLKKPYCYALALAFLVHTHAYMEGLAGMAALLFAVELFRHTRKRTLGERAGILGPLGVIGLSVILAFIQVFPAFGASSVTPESFWDIFKGNTGARLEYVLQMLPGTYALWLGKLAGYSLTAFLFYAAILLGMLGLFLSRKKALLLFIAAFAWQILFAVFIYPMTLHRVYLPLLLLVFCFCLPASGKSPKTGRTLKWLSGGLLSILLLSLLTYPDTPYYAMNDLTFPFSNQGQITYFIEKNLPPDAKIVVFPPDLITGTFGAYLPGRVFHSSADNRPFTVYLKKGKMPEKLDDDTLKKYADGRKEFYLLFQLDALDAYRLTEEKLRSGFRQFELTPLFVTNPRAFFPAREDYCIIKVSPRNPIQ